MNAVVALRGEQREHFLLRKILWHRHRKSDDEPRVAGEFGARFQRRQNAGRRVAVDRLPAAAAEQLRRACEQQFQMIVELGHGADRRARGAHRIGLVDGDGRRNTVDGIDLRPVHAVEKLPRVRRERLDVTTLALGVEGVEDQRGFARARDAGDDGQLVERQRQRQVLQIILARPANHNGVGAVVQVVTGIHGLQAEREVRFLEAYSTAEFGAG